MPFAYQTVLFSLMSFQEAVAISGSRLSVNFTKERGIDKNVLYFLTFYSHDLSVI
jgi:hypothetical protein